MSGNRTNIIELLDKLFICYYIKIAGSGFSLVLRRIRDWMALERNVLVMVFSSVFSVFGNALWMPLLPIFLRNELILSLVEIGGLYVAGTLFLTFSTLATGYVSDIVGRRKILTLGSFLLVSATLSFTFIKNWFTALLVFSLHNVATGLMMPTAAALITESVPARKRGMALAATFTFPSFPAAMAPGIGGKIIENFGWSTCFYIGAGLLLCSFMIMALFLRETLRIEKAIGTTKLALATKFRNLLRDKVFLTLVVANAFVSFSWGALRPYIAIFSVEKIGMNIFTFAAMFSVITIVVGISSLLGGKITDRLGRKFTICISEGLESVFILGFAFSPSVPLAILMYITYVAVDIIDVAAPRAWAADISRVEERGWRMGFFGSFASITRIPAAYFGGWLYTLAPRAVFFFEAAISLLAMLIILRIKEKT